MENNAAHETIYGTFKNTKHCMYLLHTYTHTQTQTTYIKHKYRYDNDIYQFQDFTFGEKEGRNGE